MTLTGLLDRIKGGIIGARVGSHELSMVAETQNELQIQVQELEHNVFEASGLAELELQQDSQGWREMTDQHRQGFTRAFVHKLITLSRVMYLINPLIRRAVTVQELYVWGSGCTIKGDDEVVTEVLDDFFKNPKNQRVIGEAWPEREREQRIDGNTFFSLYRNKVTGAARVRVIPTELIEDILCNPQDAKEPWYYIRSAYVGSYGTAMPVDMPRTAYPCADYMPLGRPAKLPDGTPIDWNTVIVHLQTGSHSTMKFGLPELYSAINWAIGYKAFLENFAKIIQAHARLAMKISGLQGKKGAAAAKSKMNTAITSDQVIDRNPPNNTAGWVALYGNADVSPIKTANSTTGPDEARALRSMVASGSDTPEHFFGDSDIGNFATSSTLDRPTELKMVARQEMWMHVILHFSRLVMMWSTQAPQGKLRAAGYRVQTIPDDFDGTRNVIIIPPAGKTDKVLVKFPTIIQRDVTDRVRAVVQAATLGGSPAEGIFPDRQFLFKLLMEALGEEDAEFLMQKYYPEPVLQGFADPKDRMADEHLTALGRKELGDAALQQADAAKLNAGKPKPSGSPAPAVSSK